MPWHKIHFAWFGLVKLPWLSRKVENSYGWSAVSNKVTVKFLARMVQQSRNGHWTRGISHVRMCNLLYVCVIDINRGATQVFVCLYAENLCVCLFITKPSTRLTLPRSHKLPTHWRTKDLRIFCFFFSSIFFLSFKKFEEVLCFS